MKIRIGSHHTEQNLGGMSRFVTFGTLVLLLSGCGGPAFISVQRGMYALHQGDGAFYQDGVVTAAAKEFYLKAIDQFNSAEKLNGMDADLHLYRGYTYGQLGEPQKAIADYNQAVKLYSESIKRTPMEAGLYNNRGWARDLLGQYKEAKDDANQSLKLDPKSAEARDTLGYALAGLGEYKAAIEQYNMAIRRSPAGDEYFHRARCYEKMGEKDLAKNDFSMAKRFY